jgi:hypothetical protein
MVTKPKLVLCLALVLSGICNAAIIYPKAPEGGRQLVIEDAGSLVREHPNDTFAVPGLRMEWKMPLPPTFGSELNAYQPYSERQIIRVLKPEAKEVMKAPRLLR